MAIKTPQGPAYSILDWTALPLDKPVLNIDTDEYWMASTNAFPEDFSEVQETFRAFFFKRAVGGIEIAERFVSPRPQEATKTLYTLSRASVGLFADEIAPMRTVDRSYRVRLSELESIIDSFVRRVVSEPGLFNLLPRLESLPPQLTEWMAYNGLAFDEFSDDEIEFDLRFGAVVGAAVYSNCRIPLKVGLSYYRQRSPFNCPDVWEALAEPVYPTAQLGGGEDSFFGYRRPNNLQELDEFIDFINRVSVKSEALKAQEDSIINDPYVRRLILERTQTIQDPVGDVVFSNLPHVMGQINTAEDLYDHVLNQIDVRNLMREGIACLSSTVLNGERCRAVVRAMPAPLVRELITFFRGPIATEIQAQIARDAAERAASAGVPESSVIHDSVLELTPEEMLCAALLAAPFAIYYLITQVDWSRISSPYTINFPDNLSTFDLLAIISDLVADLLRSIIASAIVGLVKQAIQDAIGACKDRDGGMLYGAAEVLPGTDSPAGTGDLLEDLSIILTPQELCSLFSGAPEAYLEQIVTEFLRSQYPEIWNLIRCNLTVAEYFSRMADQVDLSFCEDTLEPLPDDICDFAEGQHELRESLLRSRGIPAGEVQQQMDLYRARQSAKLTRLFSFLGEDDQLLQEFIPPMGTDDGPVPSNLPSQQYANYKTIESLEERFFLELFDDLRALKDSMQNIVVVGSAAIDTEVEELEDYRWALTDVLASSYTQFLLERPEGPGTVNQRYTVRNHIFNQVVIREFENAPSEAIARYLARFVPVTDSTPPAVHYWTQFIKLIWTSSVGSGGNISLIESEIEPYFANKYSSVMSSLVGTIRDHVVTSEQIAGLFEDKTVEDLSPFNLEETIQETQARITNQGSPVVSMGDITPLEAALVSMNLDLITLLHVYRYFVRNISLFLSLNVEAGSALEDLFIRDITEFNDPCYQTGNWLLAHATEVQLAGPEAPPENQAQQAAVGMVHDSYSRSIQRVQTFFTNNFASGAPSPPGEFVLNGTLLEDVIPNEENHSDGLYRSFVFDDYPYHNGGLLLEKYIETVVNGQSQVWNIDDFRDHAATFPEGARTGEEYEQLRWGLRLVYILPSDASAYTIERIFSADALAVAKTAQQVENFKTFRVEEYQNIPVQAVDNESVVGVTAARVDTRVLYCLPLVTTSESISDRFLNPLVVNYPLATLKQRMLGHPNFKFLFDYTLPLEAAVLFLSTHANNNLREVVDFADSFNSLRKNFEVLISAGDYRYEERAGGAIDLLGGRGERCFEDTYFETSPVEGLGARDCPLPAFRFSIPTNVGVDQVRTARFVGFSEEDES